MSTVGFTPSFPQFAGIFKGNNDAQAPNDQKSGFMERLRHSRRTWAGLAAGALVAGGGTAAAVLTAPSAAAHDNTCFSATAQSSKGKGKEKGGSCADKILQKGPFAPTNVNLFDPQIYSDAVAYKPAQSGMTEGQILVHLNASLAERMGVKAAAKAVLLMKDPALKKVVPDVALRASIVNLTGTVYEPAIQAFRDGTFSSYKFGPIAPVVRPDGSTVHPIALTTVGVDGKAKTVVNDRYKKEDFRLLTSTAGHEALHPDGVNSGKEELVANVTESDVYFQLLAKNPTLAQGKTELTQRLNGEALAKLNTRDATGTMRLFESKGTVFPTSTKGQAGDQLDSYGAAFGDVNSQPDTPGNGVLDQVLSKLTGKKISGAGNNNSTIALLDRDSTSLTPQELVQVAKSALLLNVGNC